MSRLQHAVARAAAQSAFNGLFLGLGAVALLVGAVGVANIMVISVLERRSEIGLRRALGATKGHIRTQFLSEAVLLAVFGGIAGVAIGVLATTGYAATKGWTVDIPIVAWGGGTWRRAGHRRDRRAAAGPPRSATIADRCVAECIAPSVEGSSVFVARGAGREVPRFTAPPV